MPVVMTVKELERFLVAEFPQVFQSGSGLAIEAVWERGCRVRQAFQELSVRPGGTMLAVIQDRIEQKDWLRRNGFPVGE